VEVCSLSNGKIVVRIKLFVIVINLTFLRGAFLEHARSYASLDEASTVTLLSITQSAADVIVLYCSS